VVSYADDLARKFSRDFRTIVTTDWYRDLFPAMKLKKNTETEIETTQGGYRLATSTGGVLTGRGANLIVLDDPIKPIDAESEVARPKNNEWFDKVLFSRLNSKEHGSIILVMQRLHENDLSGHLLEKEGFDLIALPAIAIREERGRLPNRRIYRRKIGEALHPQRENVQVLDEIKARVGSRVFQAQYQQSPVPAEGNLFKRSWLRTPAISRPFSWGSSSPQFLPWVDPAARQIPPSSAINTCSRQRPSWPRGAPFSKASWPAAGARRTSRPGRSVPGGCTGRDPRPGESSLSSVTITDSADPTRRGWGTYVFDPQPRRSLSLSAPHPFDDLATEDEAVVAFLALGAHTLLIAGTDRDQNTALAPCDQSNRPYLEADVSHTAESVFQMAFEEIYSSDASTWHLQFHGSANPEVACRDVDVFLSNGVDHAIPDTLYTLSEKIAAASKVAAAGRRSRPHC
jgi:hypothetical protein